MIFKRIEAALANIAATSSTKEKVKLIKQYVSTLPYFNTVVFYTYNYLYSYNIRKISPSEHSKKTTPDAIFSFLDYLTSKRGATDKDKSNLSDLVSSDNSTLIVVNMILDRDLRCGASLKLFRKAMPEIPVHEVKLCNDDLDVFWKKTKTIENACWSDKLDGVRIWAIVNPDNEIEYISRNGKPYPNFYVFDEDCIKIRNKYFGNNVKTPFILDGEATTLQVDFQKQMQQVRRLKNADPSQFRFHVFDIPQNPNNFDHRYRQIRELIGNEYPFVSYVRHNRVKSKEHIEQLKEKMLIDGKEGIVLKKWDSPYDYKRNDDWCKVKCFVTGDFPVVGWEYGTGKYEKLMGKLIIDVDGVKVGVGSGFSEKQRKLFMDDCPTMIEVKYLRKTPDGSLYLPTFVCERGDK